ncbi:MAG TPA: PCP reductase family protein [Candidatus Dormibacteraeota bacterium]|nr:PCP reductase family protein [Candidatus Dormibacteraeota bacterium]
MSSDEQPGCPFPRPDENPAESAAGGAPGCPVPATSLPPDVRWDVEAHVAAMHKARSAADTSHISQAKAEEMAQNVLEQRAVRRGVEEIDSKFVDILGKKLGYGHPLSDRTGMPTFTWTSEAESRLMEVPAFCRELTRWRVEYTALKKGLGTTITPAIMEVKYEMWGEVSHAIEKRHQDGLSWTDSARERFERVPEFVRGQVLEAVEGNARTMGATEVDDSVVDQVIERWSSSGDFHEGLYGFR